MATRVKHRSRDGAAPKEAPPAGRASAESAAEAAPAASSFSLADVTLQTWAILGVSFLALLWAYWPTWLETVEAWDKHPDYSHGYLVLPLSGLFLWIRRGEFPHGNLSPSAWGWALISVAIALRVLAAMLFIESADGWTIPLWIAGAALLAGGWPLLRWSGPAIAFLWFMFPLPYAVEQSLSRPLQSTATAISTFVLQVLGKGAVAEGNTIIMGDHTLEVEQACSGLRIFVGIFALAFAYLMFVRRPAWERILLLLSAIPIALVANSTRIVVTALLYDMVSGDFARQFTHDFSGWVMIPFAAALFWLVLCYIDRLFPEVETMDAGHLLLQG